MQQWHYGNHQQVLTGAEGAGDDAATGSSMALNSKISVNFYFYFEKKRVYVDLPVDLPFG